MDNTDVTAFDDAEVKKKYRSDWMDDENVIFINKLNAVCKNHDNFTTDVSSFLQMTGLQIKQVKNVVFKQMKVDIEDIQVRLRETSDMAKVTKEKVAS